MKKKGLYTKMNNFDDIDDLEEEPKKQDNVTNA